MHLRHAPLRSALALAALVLLAGSAAADITVGPWTFDDLAFADRALQIDDGPLYLYCGATDLHDALTGYSPDRQLANIGLAGQGNHFQLDFLDLQAANLAGADLVFFDGRFSADPYEIAVRPVDGAFTPFMTHDAVDFIDSGETDCADIWGLEIELDDFGIPANQLVDAIQFRSLPNANGNLEGDPIMAAVLNFGSIATEESSFTAIKALYR